MLVQTRNITGMVHQKGGASAAQTGRSSLLSQPRQKPSMRKERPPIQQTNFCQSISRHQRDSEPTAIHCCTRGIQFIFATRTPSSSRTAAPKLFKTLIERGARDDSSGEGKCPRSNSGRIGNLYAFILIDSQHIKCAVGSVIS